MVKRAKLAPARLTQRPAPAGFIVFSLALSAIGLAIWLGPLRDLPVAIKGETIPPIFIPVMAFLFNRFPVEFKVHRMNISSGFAEIPLILGIFLVHPIEFMPLYILGEVAAYIHHRHGIRIFKDLANFSLAICSTALAFLIFHLLNPDLSQPLGAGSILSVSVAILISEAIFVPLAVVTGMYFLEGVLDIRRAGRAVMFQTVSSVTNTCIGIISLEVLLVEPLLFLALVPPVALIFSAQVTAADNERRAQRMEFLLKASNTLHSAADVAAVAHELLELISDSFGMSEAELLLLPDSDGAARAIRFRRQQKTPTHDSPSIVEWEVLRALGEMQKNPGSTSQEVVKATIQDLMKERGTRNGHATLIQGKQRTLGMLIIAGNQSALWTITRDEETLLASLAAQISTTFEAGELAAKVHEISLEKAEMEQRALYDTLTRLANRAFFNEQLRKSLSRYNRDGRPIAMLFIDLDGFKPVNDTWGHDVGDMLLVEVGNRLRQMIREHDVAARLGGDEFALLLDGMSHALDAVIVAERVVLSLREDYVLPQGTVALHASVGVAVLDDPGGQVSAEALIKCADLAMYEAKRQGKNRYVVVQPTPDAVARAEELSA